MKAELFQPAGWIIKTNLSQQLSILDGYTKHLKNVRDYLRDGLMTRFQLGKNKNV